MSFRRFRPVALGLLAAKCSTMKHEFNACMIPFLFQINTHACMIRHDPKNIPRVNNFFISVSSNENQEDSVSAAVVIGTVAGIMALLVLLIGAIYYKCRQRQRTRSEGKFDRMN